MNTPKTLQSIQFLNMPVADLVEAVKQSIRERTVMNPCHQLTRLIGDKNLCSRVLITYCPKDNVSRIYYPKDHSFTEILGNIGMTYL